MLLIPCGATHATVRQVQEFIWERFRVQSAIWPLTDLPTSAQLGNEKRFMVIIAGPEIGPREKSSKKPRGLIQTVEQICRMIADSPNGGVLLLSPSELRRTLPLKAVTIDAEETWQRPLTEELVKAKAVVDPSVLGKRLAPIIEHLNRNLLEREEAVRLCVLSALARESIFLLGPPGVAKSLIARRIKELFPREARAFEYLMNRFSTPDEIFGPVSIVGLKADRLQRKTESYLPTADVVFLDEIWKAGPSIQNALLTAINEKIFRNDGVDQPIPLRALVSASNELPAENEGLEALWDRFLLRLEVNNIEIAEHRHEMIRGGSQMQVGIPDDQRFTVSELASLDHQIDNIVIPDEVLGLIDNLIAQIERFNHEQRERRENEQDPEKAKQFRGMYVSDRRWKKIGRLLRTSALCNSRFAVNELDCYLIAYCIWNDQEQIHRARQMVIAAIENRFTFAELTQKWERLQRKADALPGVEYVTPIPFGNHYKIDLSRNGNLLNDPKFGEFPRLPRKLYDRLTDSFQEIYLNGPGTHRAKVSAKLGGLPAQIVLMKPDDDPPLKSFAAADFQLTHKASEPKQTKVDRATEQARRFLAEISEFRAMLKARQENRDVFSGSGTHLFVDLSSDVLDRWSTAAGKAKPHLDSLSKQIARTLKEKGLE